MNVFYCAAFCLPLVLSATTFDISANNEINNDFVNVETFVDFGGDTVPYVEDLFSEETESDNDIVEEITVNQTIVDNTEVLNVVNNISSRLDLLQSNIENVTLGSISDNDVSNNDVSANMLLNVSYPNEMESDLSRLTDCVVTLQWLVLLDICLPMIISCVKKITFPNRKEINK